MSINYYVMSSSSDKGSMSINFRSTIISDSENKKLPAGHEIKYNSSGFRCDDFKTDHDLPHFLFVGCSVTFGDAIPFEDSWAYKTHEYLKNYYGSSGFYNVSALGNSIGDSVANVMKYIRYYGKPDAIFFGVPDPERISVDIDGKSSVINIISTKRGHDIFLSVDEQYKKNPFLKISFDHYLMLDQFCNSNNIKLFSTQVSGSTNVDFFKELDNNFDSFVFCDYEDLLNFLRSTEKGKDRYYLRGNDNMHPGTGNHLYWSQMFIDRIKNEKIFNR